MASVRWIMVSPPSVWPTMFSEAYQQQCTNVERYRTGSYSETNIDIIPLAQIAPPLLPFMEYPFGGDKSRMARTIGRREFILTAFATSVLHSTCLRVLTGTPRAAAAFVPEADAANSNEVVKPLVTSNVDFFIRNHFAAPAIKKDKWSLEISGMVAKPLRMSYSDLLLSSSVRRPITLECAGNFAGGPDVSTAIWTGVPLVELLKQAGVQTGAALVVFYGADSGEGQGVPLGTHFARAIPIEKAMDASTLLAYEMNDAPLPREHGFPLRALVSGWYGMDSVKWLTRVEVSREPFKGYFQQERYVAVKSSGERQGITRMKVNSKFLRPSDGEEIRVKAYGIEGVAWAGEGKVSKIELRFDGTGPWQPAVLGESPTSMIWVPWSYAWSIPRPAQYLIEVRATDDRGDSQPLVRDPDRKDDYELNTPHRIMVEVRW
jgi:DMSO/TMAO reductase YedYZ molybdopterin-dependent catalytic subunit